MEKKYFLTVEWCKDGERGIFCSPDGKAFSKKEAHTAEEMNDILGIFHLVLHPKSEEFSEKDVKEFIIFKALPEYTNQYGIVLKN